MNDLKVRPAYADALREMLLDNLATKTSRRKRRWWIGAGVAALLAISGTGGIAAAQLAVPPGTPIVATFSEPVTASFTGTASLDLGPIPPGADGITVSVTCLSAGSFTFGAYGTMVCGEGDVHALSFGAVPLDFYQRSRVTIDTTPDASWSIVAQYIKTYETDWGVNEAGQTFGAPKGPVDPDLIPVSATNCQRGYASSALIESMSPTGMTMEEAQEYIDGPNRYDRQIPVYTSDGHTVIGEIIMPGTDSPQVTQQCE